VKWKEKYRRISVKKKKRQRERNPTKGGREGKKDSMPPVSSGGKLKRIGEKGIKKKKSGGMEVTKEKKKHSEKAKKEPKGILKDPITQKG